MKRNRLIGDAQRATRKLERPPTITPYVWHGVQETLIALCSFLPNPYPSEAKLAERTRYGRASVQRYLYAAERAGLVTIEAHRHQGRWSVNQYSLSYLTVHQPDARTVHQPDALTTTGLRPSVSTSPSGKTEPPTAASPPLDGQDPEPTHPTRAERKLLPWWVTERRLPQGQEDWPVHGNGSRLNLFDGYCVLCRRKVLRLMGWLDDDGKAVHDPGASNQKHPCRYYEGARPGQRTRTAGELQPPNNERWLRAVP
jgi:hypothetical protein